MKRAIKNHIINACEAKNFPAYWVELVLEIYDAQMSAAKQRKPAKIVATIASVSASGMSRKIKFGFVRKTGEFIDISRLFAELYGGKSPFQLFRLSGKRLRDGYDFPCAGHNLLHNYAQIRVEQI